MSSIFCIIVGRENGCLLFFCLLIDVRSLDAHLGFDNRVVEILMPVISGWSGGVVARVRDSGARGPGFHTRLSHLDLFVCVLDQDT